LAHRCQSVAASTSIQQRPGFATLDPTQSEPLELGDAPLRCEPLCRLSSAPLAICPFPDDERVSRDLAAERAPSFAIFKEQLETVRATREAFQVGRVFYANGDEHTCADDVSCLQKMGFRNYVGFKSVAFLVGEDLVITAIVCGDAISVKQLARAHEARKPRIPEELRQRYEELKAQEPAPHEKPSKDEKRNKSTPKPSPEEIEAKKFHRAQKREMEDLAMESLKQQGASVAHQQRQLRALQRGFGEELPPVKLASEQDMQNVTSCMRGGLHPLRHHYAIQDIDVYIDQGSLRGLSPDCHWVVVGGGTPASVLFVPVNAFRRYVDTELIVADLAEHK